MNNGLLLLGGAAALWLLSKVHTGQNLHFLPLGVSLDGGGLVITVGVQNPTDNSLQLTSLAGDVTVNGTNAGNLSGFQPVTILPNAQTSVNVKFTPNILGAALAIINQVQNGGTVTIGVNGNANVNGVVLPVHLTFQPIAA